MVAMDEQTDRSTYPRRSRDLVALSRLYEQMVATQGPALQRTVAAARAGYREAAALLPDPDDVRDANRRAATMQRWIERQVPPGAPVVMLELRDRYDAEHGPGAFLNEMIRLGEEDARFAAAGVPTDEPAA